MVLVGDTVIWVEFDSTKMTQFHLNKGLQLKEGKKDYLSMCVCVCVCVGGEGAAVMYVMGENHLKRDDLWEPAE